MLKKKIPTTTKTQHQLVVLKNKMFWCWTLVSSAMDLLFYSFDYFIFFSLLQFDVIFNLNAAASCYLVYAWYLFLFFFLLRRSIWMRWICFGLMAMSICSIVLLNIRSNWNDHVLLFVYYFLFPIGFSLSSILFWNRFCTVNLFYHCVILNIF